MFLIRMIRCAERWEWIYFAVLLGLIALSLWHSSLGIPRMVIAFLIAPELMLTVGALFILDNLRRRADEPWL